MANLSALPIDPPGLPARPISGRLRSQLVYFGNPPPEGEIDPDVFVFAPEEVARWVDEGVIYLVSPLDTANMTEVELSEEQEEFLLWVQAQGVRQVRIVEA